MKEDSLSYISNDITLKIGEKTKIKIGFANTINLIYSGKPSTDVFSIVLLLSSGYQGYSYNLYYSKNIKTIKIGDKSFSVINITDDTLTIREV